MIFCQYYLPVNIWTYSCLPLVAQCVIATVNKWTYSKRRSHRGDVHVWFTKTICDRTNISNFIEMIQLSYSTKFRLPAKYCDEIF